MRVLHISTYDTKGGAAGSAYRLHNGLLREGIESKMYVRYKQSSNPTVIEHELDRDFETHVYSFSHRSKIWIAHNLYRFSQSSDIESFSDDRSGFNLSTVKTVDPDIINLHWVARFVDYRQFFAECVGDKPVVWRLSDLNPFTGGCHYDQGCGKYRDVCGACPQLGSSKTNDLSRQIWKRKKEAFSFLDDDQLHFVAQSEWIRDQVEASSLAKRFPTTVIPNGINTSVFSPQDTRGLRTTLEIPSSNQILLFVAQSLENRRKGFDLLRDAISSIPKENLTLLSIGSGTPDIESKHSHIHLGRIEDDILLSMFYSLADLFVIPSRQDNLPNTVLESMSCGTPVVGFDTGGIPDMVRPSSTGWLVEKGSARSLQRSIEVALRNDSERQSKAKKCRKVIKKEYSIGRQTLRYKSLYNNLLK